MSANVFAMPGSQAARAETYARGDMQRAADEEARRAYIASMQPPPVVLGTIANITTLNDALARIADVMQYHEPSHDEGYAHCITCQDGMYDMAEWPCAIAAALVGVTP